MQDSDGKLYGGTPAILLGVSMLTSWAILRVTDRNILRRNSVISMLLLCAVVHYATGALFVSIAEEYVLPRLPEWTSIPAKRIPCLLTPYFTAPALASLLAGPKAGLAVGFGVISANLLSANADSAAQTIISGAAAASAIPLMIPSVRRRSHLLRVFVLGLLLQTAFSVLYMIFSYELWARYSPDGNLGSEIFTAIALQTLSAATAFVCTILVLPLFEHIFAATSNIRLNDFTDLGHKLLCELSLKAPGTYHHSIVVATLASAAAERIGANPILARAGAYFHDIGKLENPHFFVENAGGADNHATLSPSMSALVIMAHVKNGESYACNYNLPPRIKDIIKQHHGTTVVRFFYNKALEESKKNEAKGLSPIPIDESQFRYPGPTPQTREAAIVMIADSVEAASRSLAKPTPQAIENLVNRIAADKANDGQFDACPMTLEELAKIKRVFTNTLQSQLHKRIAYPSAEKFPGAKG